MRPLLLVSLLLIAFPAAAAAEPHVDAFPQPTPQAEQAPSLQPLAASRPARAIRRQLGPVPAPSQQAIADPARTRLVLTRSAELLDQGQFEFSCRELLGMQLAMGLTRWLELGVTTTPLLAMIPSIGLENSFWSGDLRLQLVDAPVFALAAELSALAFAGYSGFRAGLAARLGNDQVAVYGNASAGRFWSTLEGDCPADGGCGSNPEQSLLLLSGGMSVRLARKVKLLFEALYYRDRGMDAILGSPAVRLHGHHFAADLGLLLVRTSTTEGMIALPMVNLSVSY